MRPDLVFVIPAPDHLGYLRPTRVEPIALTPRAPRTVLVITWQNHNLTIDSYTPTTKGHAR